MVPSETRRAGQPFVYVAKGNDEIAIFRMDPATAEVSFCHAAQAGRHPSFVAFAPSQRFAYAVNEFSNELAAFSVDSTSGALDVIQRVSSLGAEPAFVSVDPTGKWLFAANYRRGPVLVLPIAPDGTLGAPTDAKETGLHPHAIRTDSSRRLVLVPNAGSHEISVFRFDEGKGTLTPSSPAKVATGPASEPRHLEFHPTRNVVYVIGETACRVEAYEFDAQRATLSMLGSIGTLPPGASTTSNTGADLHISPDGRFLYGSNRGHDSIVVYAVQNDGRLTLVGHESTRGNIPRNFCIDPTGTFLFAANQGSNTVVSFRIDVERGTLEHLRTLDVGARPYWVGVVALAGG